MGDGMITRTGGAGGTKDYEALQNQPKINNVTLIGNKTAAELGLIDKAVNDLTNYYTKTQTYTKKEVQDLVDAVKGGSFLAVDSLPTTEIKQNVIYLVPRSNPSEKNVKDEYINLDGTTAGWEHIGDTSIDLSGYVTTQAMTAALANKVDKVEGKGLSTNDFTDEYKNKINGAVKSVIFNGDNDHTYTPDTNGKLNLPQAKHGVYNVAIASSDWSQVSGESYYSAVKPVSDFTADDVPIADIVPTFAGFDDEMTAWSKIIKAETGNGNVTFYATEALDITINVVLKL